MPSRNQRADSDLFLSPISTPWQPPTAGTSVRPAAELDRAHAMDALGRHWDRCGVDALTWCAAVVVAVVVAATPVRSVCAVVRQAAGQAP
jgi:hypothetical protein